MKNYHNEHSNILLIAAGVIFFVAIVVIFVYQDKNFSDTAFSQHYKTNDEDKPSFAVEPAVMIKDLGAMKISEERSADFVIRNIGQKPLTIFRLRTSCMCTFGQIIMEDDAGPLVSMEMHNSPLIKRWYAILQPGKTAIARIKYQPSLMPVQGPVERSFLFETNDPLRKKVELIIKVSVEY